MVDLSPMPALVAIVSPQIIYDLAANAAVEKIYLAE
jgi:GDP-D-mannose dehydratase